MNVYLKNLNKIEFVVTYACTGSCRHCSEGDHAACGESIDPSVAASAVLKIAKQYDIQTVMAFGGEPLLFPETVYAIMRAASERQIPRRQVITNGYFTKDTARMRDVVTNLSKFGVNDLLLSVDAFHMETIPTEAVKLFAAEVKKAEIPIRLNPAWLVHRDDENTYNRQTREILQEFCELGIPIGEGNIVFPAGNAAKYLLEYFTSVTVENPYVENPWDVTCVSVDPAGEVDMLNGNIYRDEILDILAEYSPIQKEG